MTAMDSIKAKFDEYEYLLRLQTEKLEELAAENERLVAACDAHGVLKSIYHDPNASQTNRLKAAAASLPMEKPKLMSVPAPLDLQAAEIVPLKELVEARRARQDRLEPPHEVINGQVVLLKPYTDGSHEPSDTGDK